MKEVKMGAISFVEKNKPTPFNVVLKEHHNSNWSILAQSKEYKHGEWVVYSAVKDNEKKDVFCLVSLIRIKRLNFDYEIYLKEMDETVHPYYYNPSNEVFNLLTPLKENKSFASNWRKKVKEHQ
tara:strand:- start:84 stop:455 length:372 start_codon:yes stop_codon:yes gene_type:complete